MIVVSSGGVAGTTTTQAVTKPMTITVAGQAGQAGATTKTVTIAAKSGTPSTTTLLNTGSGQIIAVPAQGLLQSGQQVSTMSQATSWTLLFFLYLRYVFVCMYVKYNQKCFYLYETPHHILKSLHKHSKCNKIYQARNSD